MTNFYYFDQNNLKQGPVSATQLKKLAAQGNITPKTQIETVTGEKGTADQIPGLFADSSLATAEFFYFDQANQKQGPVSRQQLKDMAAQGIIRPHTQIETVTGQKGVAGQMPGLFAVSPFAQTSFFYFDRNNRRQGPVNKLELEGLVTQGVVGPHTEIEMASGQKMTAEQIPELKTHFLKVRIMPQIKKQMTHVGSWSAFVLKLAASLGTMFATIWALFWTAKFGCLLVFFVGLALMFGAFAFRIVLSFLFG